MNELKDDYQQQILFDEETSDSPKDDSQTQILFSNQDWQPEDELINSLDDEPETISRPSWLWRSIAALFSVIVVVEAVDFFTIGFTESPIITAIYAALLFCLVIVSGRAVLREVIGLRQFKKQQQVQSQVKALTAGEGNLSASELCEKISKQLPCDLLTEQEQQWSELNIDDYSDAELLQLYSRLVLTKVDKKAVAEIAKFSSESVVLIALSPVAILDMLIMVSRNLRLIDKIAGLYGLKLGYWSRIKLIRQVFVNMVYAGASELVADFGADMLGADVLGKLSGRLSQGLGAGLLTARLGLKTLKLCRPIPFETDAPKLGDIRKEMLGQIKKLALNKS